MNLNNPDELEISQPLAFDGSASNGTMSVLAFETDDGNGMFNLIYCDLHWITESYDLGLSHGAYEMTVNDWTDDLSCTKAGPPTGRSRLPNWATLPSLLLTYPLPFPSLFPSPPPSLSKLSLPLEIGPLNTAKGSGECCKRGLGQSPSANRICCISALNLTSGDTNLLIFLRIN